MKRKILAAMLAVLCAPLAQAETFGGLEAGWVRDTNFTGAPKGSPQVAEDMMVYSGYMGGYRPLFDQRSALIVKADAAVTRLDRFDVLDNRNFGLNLGLYHGFSRSHSMTATLSGRTRRFEDELRNSETYAAQLGFKQKMGRNFWLREGLGAETAKAKINANEYNGYVVNGSLNWSPVSSTLVTLGAGRSFRNYDVPVANERTGNYAALGLVQQFGKHVYVRMGVVQQANRTNADTKYDTTVYTAGVGVNM